MKTNKITKGILFAAVIALGTACATDKPTDDTTPDNPQPGNAYLTIVGDSQYFMENGWTQAISVRYHDGSDQSLAGQVDFFVVGNSGGGTISSPNAVTNASGVATVNVLAGAQGEALFKIRAEAEFAEPVEWTIAVSEGTPPLPPLDVTGRYTVHSELDLVSGLPGDVGNIVNGFLDLTDGPNDPATFVIDLILEELDNSTVENVVEMARPMLDAMLNDLIMDYAPDFVTTILDLGDKFGQIARKFGVVSTLDVEEVGGVEGNELGATHTMTGMFFRIDADLYTFSMADLGTSNQAIEDLGFRMENEQRVYIDEHTFAMPYGALLLQGLNQVIIPMLDPYANDLGDLISGLVDCTSVGSFMADEIGWLSEGTWEGLCEMGIDATAGVLEDQIINLGGMDLTIAGQAKPMDTNTDRKIDVLLNGQWTGEVSYFDTPAPLTEATFRGERQNIP